MKRSTTPFFVLLFVLFIAACNGGSQKKNTDSSTVNQDSSAALTDGEKKRTLSPDEMQLFIDALFNTPCPGPDTGMAVYFTDADACIKRYEEEMKKGCFKEDPGIVKKTQTIDIYQITRSVSFCGTYFSDWIKDVLHQNEQNNEKLKFRLAFGIYTKEFVDTYYKQHTQARKDSLVNRITIFIVPDTKNAVSGKYEVFDPNGKVYNLGGLEP